MSVFNFFRITALLLAIISITFVLPIGVAAYHQEYQVIPSFFIPGIMCIGTALIFLLSAVIAFGLWGYVITVEQPESEKTYYDIPVVLQDLHVCNHIPCI